jgi:hypothetical protein
LNPTLSAILFWSCGVRGKGRFGWNHRLVVFAPGNPKELLMGANVLFAGTSTTAYFSLDGGQRWTN